MNDKRTNRKTLAIWVLVLLLAITMIPLTSFADEHLEAETDEIEIIDEAAEVEEAEETIAEVITSEVVFALNQTVYTVDGTNYAMDVAPYIQDSRIMVPVAHVSRALGAEVHWDPGTRTVTVTSGDDVITMVIGSATLLKNGLFFDEMDTVAVIRDIGGGLGRTMIPVSRLARALDVAYTWDPVTRSAVFMPVIVEDKDEDEEVTVPPVIYDKPGTYGPTTGNITIDNDVIIEVEDVILQNYTITGDLIIAEEVEEGSVSLNNVTVQGTTYIRGGGMETIYIDGGAYNDIIIEKIGGNVRIVYNNVEGGHMILAEDTSEGEIILLGSFGKVTILSSNITVRLKDNTRVRDLFVDEMAEKVTIITDEQTYIDLLTSNSKGVRVEGEGIVSRHAGDERDSIWYGDNVTRPRTSGGGGGGGGSRHSAPSVENVSFGKEIFTPVTFSNQQAAISVNKDESYRDFKLILDLDVKSRVRVSSKSDAYVFNKIYDAGNGQTITIAELTGSDIIANLVRGETLVNNSPVIIELVNDADTSKSVTYTINFVFRPEI